MKPWDEVLNGVVRPLGAVLFAVTFCAGFVLRMIPEAAFTATTGLVIGWYFGKRDAVRDVQGEK